MGTQLSKVLDFFSIVFYLLLSGDSHFTTDIAPPFATALLITIPSSPGLAFGSLTFDIIDDTQVNPSRDFFVMMDPNPLLFGNDVTITERALLL